MRLLPASRSPYVPTIQSKIDHYFRFRPFIAFELASESIMIRFLLLSTCLPLACFSLASRSGAQDSVSFNQQIRPILSNNCFHCHGPDEADRQADVRLDEPGDVDLEELVARITADDPDIRMPPPDSHKQLSPTQIELLQQWVVAGAPYESHWAFVPPQLNEAPPVENNAWSQHPIDRYVLAALEKKGLSSSERADKRTLLRRVTLDLTGLPPTPEEIKQFLADSSDDAYEKLIDRLLATPQYGEHMARYWLDLVRFADTNGLHHDHYREMTPYRDWVIRAFNENLPFDQFIVDQIAGDLHENPSVDQQIASGFNRLHLIIDRGTALPEESFVRNVVDRVSAVGTAFMGLTLQCAVCHDHKYDPVTQKDFYQLYAFFNNFDGEPETGFRGGLDFVRGLQPPYLDLPSPEQKAQLSDLDHQIEKLTAEIKQLEAEEKKTKAKLIGLSKKTDDNPPRDNPPRDAVATGGDETDEVTNEPTLAKQREQLEAQRKKLTDQRKQLIKAIPATLVMKEREEVRPAHILIRGVYDQPGEAVERDTPAFLPPMKKQEGLKTRLDLAEWLIEPTHPLTARVAVNRIWQQFFGVGLVRTSEDFGAQGEPPSHPQLLDYLTLRFVESGWDVKALVRSIVLSQAYQQTSVASRELFTDDPDNRLLARGSRFRLDAEVIRDQLLAVTGLLNQEQYGKSVKPPQPPGLWEIVVMPGSYPRKYKPDTGQDIYRRSVYTFWRRSLPPPQMTILDAPTRESCIARRERTNTPLQALLLMNEQQYFEAAMHYAQTLLESTELTDEERLRQAYERVTAQIPDQTTLSMLTSALSRFRELYQNDVESAAKMIASAGRPQVGSTDQQVELASWTMVINSLLNLDITKTHE